MLTQETLKQHLHYNPETGIFTRIYSKMRPDCIGKQLGCVDGSGYIIISVLDKLYRAHRLAWLYMYGEFPKFDIDHKNRNKADNRIINLREATRQQNIFNSVKKNNSSGITGVSAIPNRKNWRARTCINGKSIYIGTYKTKEEAAKAYKDFVEQIHKEFYVG